MKKLTRDLKKHYRYVERDLKEFDLDLSDEAWYNIYHQHLDFFGYSGISDKHRKKHLIYYLKLLDKIEQLTKDTQRKFQTWILIDGEWAGYDAIFFHTENPHQEFPIRFTYELEFDIPRFLTDVIDVNMYDIGKMLVEFKDIETNKLIRKYSYLIQKKGLGFSFKD